jgi:hypothetical protein
MIRHEVKRLFTGKHRRHKPTRERTIPDNDGNANLQNIRSSTLRYLQPEYLTSFRKESLVAINAISISMETVAFSATSEETFVILFLLVL